MKKILFVIAICAVCLVGCKKFDELQKDPNRSTQATPDLLLTAIEVNAFSRVSAEGALAARHLVFTDGTSSTQYYNWQRAGFDGYNQLRNVTRMEEEALRISRPEYAALAKFFKAYYFFELTQTFGDIPYSEALKGTELDGKPKYDAQEDVLVGILGLLQEANNGITSNSATIQGDVIYGGSMQKWKKLINTFTIRVLLAASNHKSNTRLMIRQRLNEMISDAVKYPLLAGNADNGSLKYADLTSNRYPYFNNNGFQTAYYLEGTFVDKLKQLKDSRLFAIGEKAPVSAALADNDFNAYAGASGSGVLSENNRTIAAGRVSRIKARYYNNPVNEASVAIGYPELQFNLAEAAAQGLIGGSAAAYLAKGVKASFDFYGVGGDADAYIAANGFNGTVTQKQILEQKHIATFMQNDWLSFFDNVRTGYPVLDVSGAGALNDKKVPKRWMYPAAEYNINGAHVTEAVARQFAGTDNINGIMWLYRAD